jgi:hypothetical protein
MKYKIAKPEDYPEVEGYAYKMIHAYGQLSSDTLVMLVELDAINKALTEDAEYSTEWAMKKLQEIIDRHKS